MSSTVTGAIAIAAAVVAVIAFVLAAAALRAARRQPAHAPRTRPLPQTKPVHQTTAPVAKAATPGRAPSAASKGDYVRLREDVAALRLDLADALRHLAVVRYDAFGDMGGHLSWSMALLDDNGNGVVLTSINGRSDARCYAKNVRDFVCESKLSPEEAEAIEYLRKEAVG